MYEYQGYVLWPPSQDEICCWYSIPHPNSPPWITETHLWWDWWWGYHLQTWSWQSGRFSSSTRSNNCTVLLLLVCTTYSLSRYLSFATHKLSCATCPVHCATDLLSHALSCTTHTVLWHLPSSHPMSRLMCLLSLVMCHCLWVRFRIRVWVRF